MAIELLLNMAKGDPSMDTLVSKVLYIINNASNSEQIKPASDTWIIFKQMQLDGSQVVDIIDRLGSIKQIYMTNLVEIFELKLPINFYNGLEYYLRSSNYLQDSIYANILNKHWLNELMVERIIALENGIDFTLRSPSLKLAILDRISSLPSSRAIEFAHNSSLESLNRLKDLDIHRLQNLVLDTIMSAKQCVELTYLVANEELVNAVCDSAPCRLVDFKASCLVTVVKSVLSLLLLASLKGFSGNSSSKTIMKYLASLVFDVDTELHEEWKKAVDHGKNLGIDFESSVRNQIINCLVIYRLDNIPYDSIAIQYPAESTNLVGLVSDSTKQQLLKCMRPEELANSGCVESKEGCFVVADPASISDYYEPKLRIDCGCKLKTDLNNLVKLWINCKTKDLKSLKRILKHDSSDEFMLTHLSMGSIAYLLDAPDLSLEYYELNCTPEYQKLIWTKMEKKLESYWRINIVHTAKLLGCILLNSKVSHQSEACFRILLLKSFNGQIKEKYLCMEQLLKLPQNKLGLYFECIGDLLSENPHPKLISNLANLLKISVSDMLDNVWPLILPKLVVDGKYDTIELIAGSRKEKMASKLIQFSGQIIASLWLRNGVNSVNSFALKLSLLTGDNSITTMVLLETTQLQIIHNLVVLIANEKIPNLEPLKAFKGMVNSQAPSVSHFLMQYCLGILTKIQNYVKPAGTFEHSIVSRLTRVKAVGYLIQLVGEPISLVASQFFGFTQIVMSEPDLYSHSLSVLDILVRVISKDVLQTHGLSVCIQLLTNRLAEICKEDDLIVSKLITFIISNISVDFEMLRGLNMYIPLDYNFAPIVSAIKKKDNTADRNILLTISAIASYLDVENTNVVELALSRLESILKVGEESIQDFLQEETVEEVFKVTIQKLFLLLQRFHTVNDKIGYAACRCLGIIGAVDPARLEIDIQPLIDNSDLELSSIDSFFHFTSSLIEDHLVVAFHSTQDSQKQSIIAYTIQQILKWCGYSKEVIDMARSNTLAPNDPNFSSFSILIDRWKKFSRKAVNTIEPLIGSRYHITPQERDLHDCPIYRVEMEYNRWLKTWCTQLISQLPRKIADLFHFCEDAIMLLDTSLPQLILPYLVLNVLLQQNQVFADEISNEIVAVLTSASRPHLGDHQQVCIQVFNVKY